MEVTLVGLAGLPSVGEFTRNDVDYTSNLLGGLIFPFLQTLLVAPLLVVSLSSSIFYFVPCFVCVVITMLILLVSFGSRSWCMTAWPLHELGWIPSLYELFCFVFQGPTIFCVVTIIVMVTAIFGLV